MGLFDFFKPKKGAGFDNWHAETDLDKFSGIELSDIETYASRIDDQIYDFVILTPPEPINGCDGILICKDGALRIELSVEADHDRKRIYGKNGFSQADAVALVADAANKGKLPKLDDYAVVGTYSDPKAEWLKRKIDGELL